MSRFCKPVSFALVLSFAGITLSAAMADGPRDTNTTKIVARVMPSIVAVARPHGDVMDPIGSGFVIDGRGYILTNHHVVDEVKQIFVSFVGRSEKTWLEASVVFSDKGNDLAVLKVDSKKRLPELCLGPSSDLKVGEPAIVIGNPLDELRTVTQGIISKVGVPHERKNSSGGTTRRYLIQTDAAVNPGNSGGPLFNANGEVVGIIELKKGTSGLGWAITADRAARVVAEGLSAENQAGIKHGISTVALRVTAAEGKNRQEVTVKKVADKSAAEKAGLKEGDRIVKVDGRRVTNPFDLERSFWDKKPGDKLTVSILRGGKKQDVELTAEGPGIEPEIKD